MKVMKSSILLLMTICAALFFSGCEKEEIMPNPTDMVDVEENILKKNSKTTFEGTCKFVKSEPNTWYDETDDWRTTGTTIWEQPNPHVFKGTATLYVGTENPHRENRGIWDIKWKGELVSGAGGAIIIATAKGKGVQGEVFGMKAEWTYTMNYKGDDFPNPANPTFFYVIQGEIYGNN